MNIIIDSLEIKAQKGMTILDAALANGIYIPHLCHHPDLKPVGACRVCMVEANGQILPACCTSVAEGMVVKTSSPAIDEIRKIVVGLIIANHDVDCLACEKNYNCKLQEIARYVGVDSTRVKELTAFERQPVDNSHPFIMRDPNKCVLCGICVRTCAEVQGVGAIDYAFRGDATKISTFDDMPLKDSECESCGECVARCPVGALLPKGFQQPAREVETICPYCGTGCGLILGIRGDKIVSARGNPNHTTNKGRLCVKGRFGWSFVHHPERLKTPLIKKDGQFIEVGWEETFELIVEKFSKFRGKEAAVFASPKTTNEEIYLASKFARVVMNTNNIANVAHLCHANTVRGLIPATGSGGMTVPIWQIKDAECLLVIGCNPTEGHPVIGHEIRKAVRRGAKMIIANPREIGLCKLPHIRLALYPGTDVALLMGMAKIILEEDLMDEEFVRERTTNFEAYKRSLDAFSLEQAAEITGVPAENIIEAARVYATSKPALIFWSMGITQHSHGHDNVWALAHLAMMTGNYGKPGAGVAPLRGHNNVQGATDLGATPPWYPGYQFCPGYELFPRYEKFSSSKEKFEKAWGYELPDFPGFSTVKQFNPKAKGWGPPNMMEPDREIKAWYIIGADLATGVAESDNVRRRLEQAEFVVVQDIFLTETAKLADVVLPAACFAEKDGTFTSTDRRVQLIRKAVEPPGEAKPDWWIICEIARRLAYRGFDFTHPSQIMDEIAAVVPSHAGISFERLEREELRWPCTDKEHPGTPVLHVDQFVRLGKAEFWPLEYNPSPEPPDEVYPFLMTTGRHLAHFHFVMTRRVEGLNELCPEDYVEINQRDAASLGIQDGDLIRISSRRGSVLSKAIVSDRILSGVVFKTIHFTESPTNKLTSSQYIDPIGTTPNTKVCSVKIEKVNSHFNACGDSPFAHTSIDIQII